MYFKRSILGNTLPSHVLIYSRNLCGKTRRKFSIVTNIELGARTNLGKKAKDS